MPAVAELEGDATLALQAFLCPSQIRPKFFSPEKCVMHPPARDALNAQTRRWLRPAWALTTIVTHPPIHPPIHNIPVPAPAPARWRRARRRGSRRIRQRWQLRWLRWPNTLQPRASAARAAAPGPLTPPALLQTRAASGGRRLPGWAAAGLAGSWLGGCLRGWECQRVCRPVPCAAAVHWHLQQTLFSPSEKEPTSRARARCCCAGPAGRTFSA